MYKILFEMAAMGSSVQQKTVLGDAALFSLEQLSFRDRGRALAALRVMYAACFDRFYSREDSCGFWITKAALWEFRASLSVSRLGMVVVDLWRGEGPLGQCMFDDGVQVVESSGGFRGFSDFYVADAFPVSRLEYEEALERVFGVEKPLIMPGYTIPEVYPFRDQSRESAPELVSMEYDQYDTPASRWVVVEERGKTFAAVRLTPTTHRCGIYSYMIRDAQRGLLEAIPKAVLRGEAPVDPVVWESSRLFLSSDVPAADRLGVQMQLFVKAFDAAEAMGAARLLGIFSVNNTRFTRRIGLSCSPVGPVFEFNGQQSVCAELCRPLDSRN